MTACPELGGSRVVNTLMTVLLPAPFGPSKLSAPTMSFMSIKSAVLVASSSVPPVYTMKKPKLVKVKIILISFKILC